MISWTEGCACHDWLQSIARDANHKPIFSRAAQSLISAREQAGYKRGAADQGADGPHFLCPMRGKRAPELATNNFSGVFDTVADMCFTEVLSGLGPGLPPSAFGDIIADFEQAKSHMSNVLTLKMQHWQTLPWKFASLAYWNEDIGNQMCMRMDCRTLAPAPSHRQPTAKRDGRGIGEQGRWCFDFVMKTCVCFSKRTLLDKVQEI